jgi:hypothetical protein
MLKPWSQVRLLLFLEELNLPQNVSSRHAKGKVYFAG